MPVAQLRDSPQPGLAAGCVLFWHETTGSPANSRPQANLPAAVTLAQRQAAICGPVPGMVARLTLVLSRRWAARTAVSSLPISEPRLSSAATMGTSAAGIAGGRCPPHPPRPMTRWTSPPPCNGPCAAPEACARNSSKPRPIVLRAMPVASDTVAIPSHPAASASEAANRRRAHSSRTGLTNSKLRLMAAVSIIAKTTEQCPKRESSAPNPFDSSNYRRILRTVIGIRGRSFTFTGMTGGLWLVHDPPCCHQS